MSMRQISESKMVRTKYAESLEEVYQHIHNIVKDMKKKKDEVPVLWYRGHANSAYNLNPSIFRDTEYHYNSNQTYSNNHLREDYRFQSFMSRNYDNIDYRMPQSVIEWQEVMQHFFTKTRLMDWSESLIVSLEFALEAFLMPYSDLEVMEKRRTASPVIWILNPAGLNKEVYQAFIKKEKGGYPLIEKVLDKNCFMSGLSQKIGEELKKEEKDGTYYDLSKVKEKNMNSLISLSSLEIMRNTYKGREEKALKNFEMNPFFYLLLRYYSDGIPVEYGKLPPLAIIHPYHSHRIRIQKGVFTVFPYYIPDELTEQLKKVSNKATLFAMEYMSQCMPYLYEIRIMNPQRVADELIATGGKRSNLYPEMQIVSQDMENAIM